MSELVEIVDSLENKFNKIIRKMEVLEQNNLELKQQLKQSSDLIQSQTEQVEVLKKKYETLKITNALLGSNENTKDTKLKINSLIREIDYCIAQLSD
jgi:small-conductance mechanosensitive channel